MATELSRGEILCRALCMRGLSKDWYLLSASEQIAMDEAGVSFAEDVEENASSTEDLAALESEIAERKFGFYVDADSDEHFVRGDTELARVVSWTVRSEETGTIVRLVIPRVQEWSTTDAADLIEALQSDGHEVVYEDELSDETPVDEPPIETAPPATPEPSAPAQPPEPPRRGGRRRAKA